MLPRSNERERIMICCESTSFDVVGYAALMVGSFAEHIREGAKMEVKADSIWLLEVGNLSTWQKLKKAGIRQNSNFIKPTMKPMN